MLLAVLTAVAGLLQGSTSGSQGCTEGLCQVHRYDIKFAVVYHGNSLFHSAE